MSSFMCLKSSVPSTGTTRLMSRRSPFRHLASAVCSAFSLRSLPYCPSTVYTPACHFGNAPSRVRPVETPQEYAWRQSERELSASIVIVIMIVVPLWLLVLSAESQEKKREAVLAWAREQRAAHHPTETKEGEE
ncbi:hypothetical protein ABL78_7957 [Leptomonas seymouri]|uniref:Transmembrane protein n=1 Tax=Leptomonas seymouri TaxID=5684 RepID=A0A0N0P2J6_LEPSE|nr:hypothetical protein ABL78_7957 [Leptomonas seymouri]|eukprot:KPI83029.1 hypothetical protein ABL78_7957 [Leptomonas seymouri]